MTAKDQQTDTETLVSDVKEVSDSIPPLEKRDDTEDSYGRGEAPKWPADFRNRVKLMYLSGRFSNRRLSKMVKVPESTLGSWITRGKWREQKAVVLKEAIDENLDEMRQHAGKSAIDILKNQMKIVSTTQKKAQELVDGINDPKQLKELVEATARISDLSRPIVEAAQAFLDAGGERKKELETEMQSQAGRRQLGRGKSLTIESNDEEIRELQPEEKELLKEQMLDTTPQDEGDDDDWEDWN